MDDYWNFKTINAKDKLYKVLKQTSKESPNYADIQTNFKTYRNIIRRSIMFAKRDYYQRMFNTFSNDMKKTWQTIHDTLNRSKKTRKFPQLFKLSNGTTISDPKIIAEAFNDYFINIGNVNEPMNDQYTRYLHNKPHCNLIFHSITKDSVMQIIVFHYSTFGLRNSGATFQRMMDQIFGHLPYCRVYIDNILVASENHREHRELLQSVLELLRKNGLVIRRDKCAFGASTVEFLGHNISGDGIRPLASKIDAINRFPRPTTVKQLQEFLGMINYYHRFIPNAAGILTPLYHLSSTKEKQLEEWNQTHEHAFTSAKDSLAQAVMLATPNGADNLFLVTDASNIAIGAVLEQGTDGHRRPLGFFSRKLNTPQQKYSTFDRELLAVHSAIRHFRYMLEGTSYTICTDHKPLVTALSKTSDAWTSPVGTLF